MREGGSHLQPSQGGGENRSTNRQRSASRQEWVREEPRTTRTRQDETRQGTPRRQQTTSRSVSAQGGEPWRESAGRNTEEPAYRQRGRDGRRGQNVLLIILILLLLGGMIFAGWKLASIFLEYHRDRSAYKDLANMAITDKADTEENGNISPDFQGETEKKSEVPIAVDWDYLRSVNSDVVGWLYCPGTIINYPVVQASDNDYYLHRNFADQTYSVSGTLFMDMDSSVGITLSNCIIYGHHMKDGSMFAMMDDYAGQDFYEEHPVMYFLTPRQDYRVDLISGRIVESTLDNYPLYFTDAEEYQSYLNDITSRSYFSTHATVSTDYQLITFSTCNYSSSFIDPRFMVQGLMVPIE